MTIAVEAVVEPASVEPVEQVTQEEDPGPTATADSEMPFEPTDSGFTAKARGYNVLIANGEADLTVGNSSHTIHMGFVGGAEEAVADADDPSLAAAEATSLSSITYRDIYPGIDVVYSDDDKELEYSFVVHADGDPSEIAIEFSGVRGLEIREDGTLLVDSRAGRDLKTTAPYAYQEIDGGQTSVDSSYVMSGDGTIGFAVGEYDPTFPLTIDPTFVASSSAGAAAASLTLDLPAGVVADDLLLAQILVRDDGAAFTAPTGWTLVRSDAFTGELVKQEIYYRVAGSSEPATYTWTFDKSDDYVGAIAAYRDVDVSDPINTHDANLNNPGSPTIAPSITTTVADTTLIGVFGHRDPDPIGAPASMTENWNYATGGLAVQGADETLVGPGATGTRTAIDASGTANISALIASRRLRRLTKAGTHHPRLCYS